MLSNKSRHILVLAILLVILAGFTCYCFKPESSRPPGFLIWIEKKLFAHYRPARVLFLDSGGFPTVDDIPEIP